MQDTFSHCHSCYSSPSSGFALAIVSHVLCSRFPMFAAKLLTHMMLSCLGTQVTLASTIPVIILKYHKLAHTDSLF